MVTNEAKYLLLLYSGITLMNVAISFWFWRKSRLSIYSSLVRVWVGLSLVLVLSALTQGDSLLFPLVGMIPGCYIAAVGVCEVLLRFIGKKPNYKILRSMPIVTAVATLLLYYAGMPFVIFAIPAALMNLGPILYGLVRLLREKQEKLTPAKVGFTLASWAMVLHAFDFPFLGNKPETIAIGFSIGVLIVCGFAIFGPLVVLEVANAEAAQLKHERGVFEKELKEAELMLKLVADTASLLPLSLDYKGVLNRTVKLGVDHFGGICALHMLDDGLESVHLAAFAHAETLNKARGPSRAPAVVMRVIHEGQPSFGLISPEERIGSLNSYVSVPLFDRARACGALTLFSAGQLYTARELRLATELAGRASSAIQSAKLFQEAKQAVRLRDDFLAVASHELKTPLTSLNIQVETLRRLVEREKLDSLPQDQLKRMLQMSADQLKSLAKLIDGLLDVSRMAAQGVVLGSKEDVDLGQLVHEITGRFESQLQAAHCALEIHAEPGVVGHWDRLRMEQIVTNLLTNAMKYGAGKPIKIEVNRAGNQAFLVVQDAGIGVLAADQERIFGRFERAVPVQRFGGLGLGLYISREIARTHGGTIQVESEPGVKTRFIVELPLKLA